MPPRGPAYTSAMRPEPMLLPLTSTALLTRPSSRISGAMCVMVPYRVRAGQVVGGVSKGEDTLCVS